MPEFAKNRYEICKRCSYRVKECGQYWCSKCYCALPQKAMIEDEECLDGRWFKINVNERK